MPVSPIGAWVVVMAQSMVLFIFSSTTLVKFVVSLGLPPYPLVPVSSSQAVIGAVIGIGLTHGISGAQQIKWRVLLNIASGWVRTPIISALLSFIFLFFLQNVFQQQVYQSVNFKLSASGIIRLADAGISSNKLQPLQDREISQPIPFRDALRELTKLSSDQEQLVIETAERYTIFVDPEKITILNKEYLNPEQIKNIALLAGHTFQYKWEFERALIEKSTHWQKKPKDVLNQDYNDKLAEQFDYLFRQFHVDVGS